MPQTQISGKRKAYVGLMKTLMVIATLFTCALVLFLVAFLLVKGLPHITWELFSTRPSYLSDRIGILPDILNLWNRKCFVISARRRLDARAAPSPAYAERPRTWRLCRIYWCM